LIRRTKSVNIRRALSRSLVAVTATLGLLIGAPAAPAALEDAPAVVSSSTVAGNPVIKGGCIRLYASGPKWHVDVDHHTVGIDPTIDPVIDSAGLLTFWTEDKAPVISIDPSPDETLTARGISVGGSNGSHLVRLQFYKDGINGGNGTPLDLNNPVHYDRVSGEYANVWVVIVSDPPVTP
jgi:hypothetical protein